MTNKSPSNPMPEKPKAKLAKLKSWKEKYLPNHPWKQLEVNQRVAWVFFTMGKVTLLLASIYMFFANVGLLSSAFKVISASSSTGFIKKATGPCAGLLITIIFQSSSSTTSLVVSLVSAGILQVSEAIPIIMGANVGTSITSTIVTLGHIEGATVHDFFNIILLLIFSPLEVIKMQDGKGLLEMISSAMLFNLSDKRSKIGFPNFIKKIDKKAINAIRLDPTKKSKLDSLIKAAAPDKIACAISIVIGLILMGVSLYLISKLMSEMIKNQSESMIKNALLKNGVVAMLLGALVTVLVQSSSVTTTTLVPLVATGYITLEQMFPLTLGANVGTTLTAILAAFSEQTKAALQIALCHLLFNLIGILMIYPIPYIRSAPIECSRALGFQVKKNRYFGFIYVGCAFFVLPIILFAISLGKGGDIAGAVIIYVSIRVRAPHLIPENFPPFLRPNNREELEKAERDKKKKEYIDLINKI